MKTYLIPTVFTADNKFPMEYKVVTRKRDMRTKFCKNMKATLLIDIRLMNLTKIIISSLKEIELL